LSGYEKDAKSKFQWTAAEAGEPERALVLAPDFQGDAVQSATGPDFGNSTTAPVRSAQRRLEEAKGLARAISLNIIESGIVPVKRIRPATLFGSGKTDELAGLVKAENIGLAIVDASLSPVQQRNLEKAWNCKVLDRTGLILEIFGERAQTREGRLQVELAHLNYQKGRLVRQWTHLERQRGGLGKTGGPGETQIEADRRLLQDRILRLEKDLAKVRQTRNLHRAKRKRVPSPVVALVGYTNAGKSTLFNRLTESQVFAKDLLFATLDPTLRRLKLPHGSQVILSDTVGFVSNLPTTLVAAFRATLEEVVEADLIIHVRDIADPDSAAQAGDVYTVLEQIGIIGDKRDSVLEVWNKIDLLDHADVQAMRRNRTGEGAPILVSAVTAEGIDQVLERIETLIAGSLREVEVALQPAGLDGLPWLYENAIVLARDDRMDGSVRLKLQVTEQTIDEMRTRGYLAKAA